MDNRPIGVFDSGLGGLTGVRELRKRLPHEEIVYFGDTGRVPYGSRSPETILQYARQDIAFLLSQNVKCIMAACGTVSSTYPAAEAARLPVPYLGVVDATHLKMRVWERGSGETWACGTGTCATVAALTELGICPAGEDIHVQLRGGVLTIRVLPGRQLLMTGAAETVCEGTTEV